MIDTTSITDLFRFMVSDLEAGGNVLHSRDPGTQQLLEHGRVPPSRGEVDIELDFSIEEFASTIRPFDHSTIRPFDHSTIRPFDHSTIRPLGDGAEFMWPGSTTESAGLRLLLTHLDEQRASTNAPPRGPIRLSLHDSEPLLVADDAN